MYPYLLQIGSFQLPSFGVLLALGFLGSMLALRQDLRRRSFDTSLAETLALAAMVGGLIGAKVYYLFEVWPYFLQDPVGTLFSGAGFTFYGGLAGGTIGVLRIIHRQNLPTWTIIDAVALSLPVGYAIGRIGCQLAGDGDYGTPTDLPWGMAYPDGLVPTMERVHPTPVYETLQSFLVFGVLLKLRSQFHHPGQLFCVYLILTGLARFWVEYIRLNLDILWGLSDAQIISVLMVAGGTIGLWRLSQKAMRSVQTVVRN